MRLFLLCLFLLLPAGQLLAADCAGCHDDRTPGIVDQWRQSAHARAGIGCADCHGEDHERILDGQVRVSATVCGRCHDREWRQHAASRHGLGLHSGWGCTRNLPGRDRNECAFCHRGGTALPVSTVNCARFLEQSSAMGQVGCNRCHQVENACGSCHGNHLTDLSIVRDPQVCAKCHMGPDHPQWEMWQTSQHGQLWRLKGEKVAPSCQGCHMPDGTHDVSGGIAHTPGGKSLADDLAPARREAMLDVCSRCHAASFVRRELERGDAVLAESRDLVEEAAELIEDLASRGLLRPMPEDRPPHPLRGKSLVLDGQMLYEDTSGIESLFFRLKKFAFAKTWKGAFHQNPAWAHWYGNAELKLLLEQIRSEADRLEHFATGEKAVSESQVDRTTSELDRLRREHERGRLDDAAYRKARTELLESWLKKDAP
ncbi:multi-heme cytochrome with CxxCH motif [Geothermobacter ehrlichii]|uniref:Multi-heme cytochrome with CxxCH motif n=1 Tax=Geothermobacter ehrlichii TaxID=213224 RepID=A0A5D3WPP3_9BACT|nr:multiheme c-type cytochrome [Geothermobacter ehrlichii]TYO99661.1 multi-heme cytochrome with CxxCH motif [Geothermobacter ehrlichii]